MMTVTNKYKNNNIHIYTIFTLLGTYMLALLIITENSRYSSIILFVLLYTMFIFAIIKKKVRIDILSIVNIVFTLYYLITYLNTPELIDSSYGRMKTIIYMLFLFLLVLQMDMIKNMGNYITKLFLVVGILYCSYYVYTLKVTGIITAITFGDRFGGSVNNINELGMFMTLFFLFFIHIGNTNKRWIYYLLSIIPACIVIATNSRKAIIGLIIGLSLYIYLCNHSKKKLKTIFYICILLIFIFGLLQLPVFENIYNRMSSLWKDTADKSAVQSSYIRSNMIDFGLTGIKNKPIFGHGFNMFTLNYGYQSGTYTYSHNNYIELLYNQGILGLVLYYLRYIIVIKGMWIFIRTKDKLGIILLVFLILSIAYDFACVSYYNPINYVILLISYLYYLNTKTTLMGKLEYE